MEKHSNTKKKTNAEAIEEVKVSLKSLQRQTSDIKNDLAYIKAKLECPMVRAKLNLPPTEDTTIKSGSWWWG